MNSSAFFVGSLFMMMRFIVLDVAVLRAPTFRRRPEAARIVLGLIGVVGVVASLFDTEESGVQIMGIAFSANIIFLSLFGGKVYNQSREPHSPKTLPIP
jgi:hypothetical protein